MVRSCVGGLSGGGGKGMTRRQKGIPSYSSSQPTRLRRFRTGTHIVYIMVPSRTNVPALKAVNWIVRMLINRRGNEELLLEALEPTILRQATP